MSDTAADHELYIRRDELVGGALTAAALSGTTPHGWYDSPPRDAQAWANRATSVRKEFADNHWFDALAPAFGESPPARLRNAAVVVTTGQQPGLFGGPMYTWYKAFAALELANALEASTGISMAPVFWAATDDSDFAEASWTAVSLPGGAERLTSWSSAPEGVPMSDVPLGDVRAQLEVLLRTAGSASFVAPIDAVTKSYSVGATVGSAYLALLRSMLQPLGIAVLDASHGAARAAAAPLLVRALEGAEAVDVALRARAREIEAAGFKPQVSNVPGLTTVFDVRTGTKRRVTIAEARELARRSSSNDQSANVLLRPVVERFMLPTVAYLAGPGEIAYFAQSSAVADALDVPRPLALPRWSGTIIEPQTSRIMGRLGITLDDVHDRHEAETNLALSELPSDAVAAVARLRAAVDAESAALVKASNALLPAEVIQGHRNQLLQRIDRLERRLVAAQKRASTTIDHDLGTVCGALSPLGKRQERALNFLPLWAKHGEHLLQPLLRNIAAYARELISPPTKRDASAP